MCVCVKGVLEEAEFYNVADLVALVKERIAERDATRRQVSLFAVKSVFFIIIVIIFI